MSAMNDHRWFWFECTDEKCGYKAVRYRSVRKCPRCNGPLKRLQAATQKEVDKPYEDYAKRQPVQPAPE